MKNDPVRDALDSIKVGKIQVRLSKSNVVNSITHSGLWPRVTLEVNGKSKTFPMTWFRDISKYPEEGTESLTELEHIILRFVGGNKNTQLYKYGRKEALNEAHSRIETAIRRAINKASNTKKINKRHETAQRQDRVKRFLIKFQEFCEVHGESIEYEDIKPSHFGKVWDDIRRDNVAKKIMDA